jgi:antitoxin ParD1/3/4
MPTRNVVITDHQAALIERLVASGRYQNASEVLREGLRLVERREAEHARRLAAFDAAIAEGEADLAAGRYTEISSPEELRAFLSRLGREDAA